MRPQHNTSGGGGLAVFGDSWTETAFSWQQQVEAAFAKQRRAAGGEVLRGAGRVRPTTGLRRLPRAPADTTEH